MVSGVKGLVKSIEPAKWFSASGILFDPEPIDWKGIFGLDSGTNANTSDVKVSAKDSSAYEAEAYRSTNTGDTFNFNYPTLNGVHNLSDLVEEMAKLKQISDRAGGAFSKAGFHLKARDAMNRMYSASLKSFLLTSEARK